MKTYSEKKIINSFEKMNGKGINFNISSNIEKSSYKKVLKDLKKTVDLSQKLFNGKIKKIAPINY